MNNITKQILESKELTEFVENLVEKRVKENNAINYERYVPEKGDGYYYIDSYGRIYWSAWSGSAISLWRLSQHNIFRTEEQAEYHKKMVILKAELKDFTEELSKDNPVNWNDVNQGKYYFCFDYKYGDIVLVHTLIYTWKGFNIYCTDSNFREKAIDKFGEETLIEILTYEGYL